MRPVVVSTGQHRGMVADLLAGFGIGVDIDLQASAGALTDVAGHAVAEIGRTIRDERLDAVVVQGDTTAAFAGGLAAFYERVPVIHLEAGLRTDDRFSPYPEEVHRRMITSLSDLHLAPTPAAANRLQDEGVPGDAVAMTGNTVVDALFQTVRRRSGFQEPKLGRIPEESRVMLVTAHRRESWGEGIRSIARAVIELVDRHQDLLAVVPLHPNPRVRDEALDILAGVPRVIATGPLCYADMVGILDRATLVVTDSGGVQEEACSLGTPTLVTRDTTERPEGLASGGLRLIGTDEDRIVAEATRLLIDPAAYEELVCRTLPFGDGLAAGRAVSAITEFLEARGLLSPVAAHRDVASMAVPA
jgi:UDP-N-acetylglucosamine 2-epimerase (non-hydrolysing)